MATITININGVDKSNQIDWTSVQKDEVLTKQADSLRFNIKNFNGKTYRPALGDEVTFYNGATKIFGGYVVELNEEVEGLVRYLEVVCKDYTQTLDRNLVSKNYTDQTANAIIADLITTFTTGFTTTNVNATVVIPFIQFNYLTVSQCLQKIVSILGNYDWYVDYNKDIHFFNNSIIAAPFAITDTSANYVWGSLKIHDETHQIRNEIIIRGGEITSVSLRTEYFDGDGTKLIFPLGYKYSEAPTITVGGVGKTVGVDNVDTDSLFQIMWNKDQQSIRFTSGNTPAAGTRNIVLSGYPLYPLVFRKQNQNSIALYGIYQYLIIDKTIADIDTASKRADAEILKYANPAKTGEFETHTDGLIAGQTISVSSSIRSVSQSYKIQSITTSLRTLTTLKYKVKIVTADDIGINDILNKLLIKNPSDQIDIGANEVVQRYYAFSEALALTETLHAPTKSSPPYVWDTMVWDFFTWG